MDGQQSADTPENTENKDLTSEQIPERRDFSPDVIRAPREKKSRKKHILLILALVLLLGGGAAAYFMMSQKDDAAPQQAQTNNQSEAQTAETEVAKFYFTKRPNEVVTYNLADKTQTSVTLDMDDDHGFHAVGVGGNQPVLLTKDGKHILYATAKFKPEGLAEIESTHLFLKDGETTTKIVEYLVSDSKTLTDWAISPDGATVYYLVTGDKSGTESAQSDLHMVTVSSKKDTVLKEKIAGAEMDKSPLHITSDGSLRLYVNTNTKITEHKVLNGAYSTREVGSIKSTECSCFLEYPQAVSPDGKWLLLEEQTSGEPPADFIYSLMDTATGTVTELAKAETNEQWTASHWSPDSKQIAFDVATFGDPPATFKPRIGTFDIAGKKLGTLVSGENKDDSVHLLGWSGGSQFLAFVRNNSVHLYDFGQSSVADTGINAEALGSSDTAFGWY